MQVQDRSRGSALSAERTHTQLAVIFELLSRLCAYMSDSWQVVPDENEEEYLRKSSADLRRIGGLAVVILVVAALTASIPDQSSLVPLSMLAVPSGCNPHGASNPTGAMSLGRAGHTATLLRSGKVLVAGGRIDPVASHSPDPTNALTASAELYDPTTGTWSATGSMKFARTFHAASLLRSGKVLVAGGRGDPWEPMTTAELYDPDTGNWTETGGMRAGRDSFAAIVLRSGKVFATPGLGPGNPTSAYELYDPARGSWSAIGGSVVRFGSATLLASGKVLVIGRGSLGAAQLYDPPSNSWQPAGTMITTRDSYTTTLLPSGKVLVAGGDELTGSSGATSSVEIFDPAGGRWTQTNSMTSPHSGANAMLLPIGEVLVAGGGTVSSPLVVDAVDLYEPGADSWTALGVMAAPRSFFTATLLRSGALLFAGGYGPPDGNGFSASAEIYTFNCNSR